MSVDVTQQNGPKDKLVVELFLTGILSRPVPAADSYPVDPGFILRRPKYPGSLKATGGFVKIWIFF